MPEYIFKVSRQDIGRRLDLLLLALPAVKKIGLSRCFIQKLILEGKIRLKNGFLVKPSYKVKPEDEIIIFLEKPRTEELVAENIPLEVIYEDDYLAVINKPSGLVVHPAPGNYTHTLVNGLLYRFKKLSSINPARPGIVHRLDKETSGLLVVAKDNSTHLALAKQFTQHTIKRRYVAVVEGRIEFDEGIIELPIGRHPRKRESMTVSFNKNAKYAKTYYRTLKRTKDFSLLELQPYTGRTHQLRVHLKSIGHPILGDSKYGRSYGFKRLALHAQYLGFVHPKTKKFVEFFSPIPEEFSTFLKD